MEHTIKSRFDFGDTVYRLNGSNEGSGQVIGFRLDPGYTVLVYVQWGHGMDEYHYDFELSRQKQFTTSSD